MRNNMKYQLLIGRDLCPKGPYEEEFGTAKSAKGREEEEEGAVGGRRLAVKRSFRGENE
jgi:hypothetical protein